MPASRERDLQRRVPERVTGPQPVRSAVDRRGREQRAAELQDRRVLGDVGGEAGRPDVQADHGLGLDARLDHRVPGAGVQRRAARAGGELGNVRARKPRAALRRISAAASTGSARYVMPIGMLRSGCGAYHSSWYQSFHAPRRPRCRARGRRSAEHGAAEAGDLRREVDRGPHAVEVHVVRRGPRCRSNRGAPGRSASARASIRHAGGPRPRRGTGARTARRRSATPGCRRRRPPLAAQGLQPAGKRPSNMCGGSTRWSSTEMTVRSIARGSGSGNKRLDAVVVIGPPRPRHAGTRARPPPGTVGHCPRSGRTIVRTRQRSSPGDRVSSAFDRGWVRASRGRPRTCRGCSACRPGPRALRYSRARWSGG